MRKLVAGLLAINMCLCLIGCRNGSNYDKRNNNTLDNAPIAEELRLYISSQIAADIYIDGTFSMGGYVNSSHSTVFINSVKQIDSAVNSTWKNAKISYIKFGDKNTELSRDGFLNFIDKNFYNEVDTSLNKVIDSFDNSRLNIIITDLFQTNQDIESLPISLKKCFNDASKAVAIIGQKGQFNGEIYDVGRNKAAFKYNSGNNYANYRPFYIIVTGKESDVRALVERYVRNAKDCRVAFFGRNIGYPSVLTSNGNVRKNEDKGYSILASLGKDNGWPKYRLKVEDKKAVGYLTLTSANLVNSIPEKFDATYMNIEAKNISSRGAFSKISRMFGGEKNNNSDYSIINNVDSLRLITLQPGEEKQIGNKIERNLRLIVDPMAINKKPGNYRVKINISAERNSYKLSNRVFDDWNFEDNRVLNEKIWKEVGKKTQNVTKFTDLLSDMNCEINKPGFNDLYIYFDAK